jgi:hypothetical protein
MDGMVLPLGAQLGFDMDPIDTVVISENDETIMGTICHFSDIGILSRWFMENSGGSV